MEMEMEMEMEQYSSFPHHHHHHHHHDLPPGFRFHPTDEELISHYLSPKLLRPSFSPLAIADADFNNSEPWDLPRRAKMTGGGCSREWYFFCLRDRKYPTGSRTNRATPSGYWKATGKDKHIFHQPNNTLIGFKKTLVFYTGRAPKGGKTNWVMHEYRIPSHHHKNEWVLCRVFLKGGGGKRMVAETIGGASSSELPPLMDASPNQPDFGESSHSDHVTCFSDPNHPQEDPIVTRDHIVDTMPNNHSSSHNHFPSTFLGQDQPTMMMMGNNGWGDFDADISSVIYNTHGHDIIHGSSHNQQYYSSASAGPVHDIGSLWNYST